QFLYLDTDRSSLLRAQEGPDGERLLPEEVLHCPLYPTEHYRDQSRNLLTWLDRRWLYGIPRSLKTEGLRPLGRLALVDHAAAFLALLRKALSGLASQQIRAAAIGATGCGLRNENPRVFVVASVAGGTGGGMLVDAGYAVRQILTELNLPTQEGCALLL